MKSIDEILRDLVAESVPDNEVAVLLSGGVDSNSLAFAAHQLGKKVTGYTFYLESQPSYDSMKAAEVCNAMGWNCVTASVPIDNLHNDFFTLHRKFHCVKKTHYECTFPFLYVYPLIQEKYILSGIAADGHYGVSKKACMHYKEPKSLFDRFRYEYFNQTNPAGFAQQIHLATAYDKKFVAPYLHHTVKEFFSQYDWFELNQPYQKHHVREAFPEFKIIKGIKNHINLQLGAGVDKLFESVIIQDPTINFKNRKRIMDICRDWAKH